MIKMEGASDKIVRRIKICKVDSNVTLPALDVIFRSNVLSSSSAFPDI